MTASILNAGDTAWIFEEHARRLARTMNLEVSAVPAEFNYVLGWEGDPPKGRSFVPFEAIRLASDKRCLAAIFEENQIANPKTYLLDSQAEVNELLEAESRVAWMLKWPTGCGGVGHRLQDLNTPIPRHWPKPYILQQFVPMAEPEVYRLYCVAKETFGWNVRRFPTSAARSPFVAHARGARYEAAGNVPTDVEQLVCNALACTGLAESFGCGDLIADQSGRWLVLEVGTDGKIAKAFRKWCAC